MRKLVIALTLLATSLSAADYSGIWEGKGGNNDPKYGLVPQTAEMTLQQAGSSLKGTLKIGNGNLMTITSGSVSGTTITFAIGSGSGTAQLTSNGSQLVGTLTSSHGKVLEMAFTKR